MWSDKCQREKLVNKGTTAEILRETYIRQSVKMIVLIML